MIMIETKYYGPTGGRGARIRVRPVSIATGMTVRAYAYDHGARDPHLAALAQYVSAARITQGRWDWCQSGPRGTARLWVREFGGGEFVG